MPTEKQKYTMGLIIERLRYKFDVIHEKNQECIEIVIKERNSKHSQFNDIPFFDIADSLMELKLQLSGIEKAGYAEQLDTGCYASLLLLEHQEKLDRALDMDILPDFRDLAECLYCEYFIGFIPRTWALRKGTKGGERDNSYTYLYTDHRTDQFKQNKEQNSNNEDSDDETLVGEHYDDDLESVISYDLDAMQNEYTKNLPPEPTALEPLLVKDPLYFAKFQWFIEVYYPHDIDLIADEDFKTTVNERFLKIRTEFHKLYVFNYQMKEEPAFEEDNLEARRFILFVMGLNVIEFCERILTIGKEIIHDETEPWFPPYVNGIHPIVLNQIDDIFATILPVIIRRTLNEDTWGGTIKEVIPTQISTWPYVSNITIRINN